MPSTRHLFWIRALVMAVVVFTMREGIGFLWDGEPFGSHLPTKILGSVLGACGMAFWLSLQRKASDAKPPFAR